MLARLSILSGKRKGDTVELSPGTYQVGTGRGADIQLRDKGVGFKHAVLVVGDGGEVTLEDLKSRGGTFLGDAPVDGTVALAAGGAFRVGTVDLTLEVVAAAAESAPAAVEPEPAAVEPEPAAVEPEPAAVEPAAAGSLQPTRAEDLPEDVELLKAKVREVERQYLEKAQEAAALSEALEGQPGGEADAAYDAGIGGYSESVSADLEVRILELQQIADEQTAALLEKDEVIGRLEKELALLRERNQEALEGVKREQEAMARDVLRGHEKAQEWRQEVGDAQAEVTQFEQVNAELLLDNEELKEKVEALRYQVEQEAGRRGELVRERIVELRDEVERLEASNAELRTLVEAYEEKIDELDERVEEVEGENEAHQTLVADLRDELQKATHERETMVKTLRKKMQTLEMKVERLQGEKARARAAAESSP